MKDEPPPYSPPAPSCSAEADTSRAALSAAFRAAEAEDDVPDPLVGEFVSSSTEERRSLVLDGACTGSHALFAAMSELAAVMTLTI